MWTFYGLAEIGALTGAIVRRWQARSGSDNRPGDGPPDDRLLSRRMTAMDVDADTFVRLEPALYGNLQTICGECDHPNLCRHDLGHDPTNAAWEDYCPNAVVLHAIKELRWFRLAAKGDV